MVEMIHQWFLREENHVLSSPYLRENIFHESFQLLSILPDKFGESISICAYKI